MKVIAYYPGAGGSRFKNKLLGLEYSTNGRIYDSQQMSHRYLNDGYYLTNRPTDDIVQLHCMNTNMIRQYFPDAFIYMIRSDLKPSLKRYWTYCYSKMIGFDNILDNAFSCISWHLGYYKTYPVQLAADELIDIDSASVFGQVMTQEFAQTNNKIFELAWDTYQQYGPTAPVIDIWNKLNEQK